MSQPRHKEAILAARRRRRAHYSRWFKKLSTKIIPKRASTQTWMILTFGLFVGSAVFLVGLYVTSVLNHEVQNTVHRELYEYAQRIAAQISQFETPAQRQDIVDQFSSTTGLHVSVVTENDVFESTRGNPPLGQRLAAISAEPGGISRLTVPSNRAAPGNDLYGAVYQAQSDLAVRVVASWPSLSAVVNRVKSATIAGMILVLLLSVLGSWIAARQVVKPLHAIRNSAHNISEGMFDERIRVDSRAAEFQELARRLNLMSASFREKIKEMQRLAQLQNEFIGNVSHEVRNPIFAVSGYLEALSSSSLKDDLRKRYAEKGLANLQRLNNLFNDLIEIARLEYREDLIQPRIFNLLELLEEISDMLKPKAEEKGLRLEIENPSVHVLADRNRIRQVLINLIDNAIAYTDQGTVRCRFRRRLDKVRVEVIDTGRGIPEEHLDRIFERFYRVDPDRSRKSGGTGLGLSIVRQILLAHGEPIHVESTFGRGTRFWFELPYAQKEEHVEVT